MAESLLLRLKTFLDAGKLPGADAQYLMAPKGRPMQVFGEIPDGARKAAVCISLFPDQDAWCIPLMERPDYSGVHSAQISLPGGKMEEGENPVQTALRELHEETGLVIPPEQVLGMLTPLYIPPSNFYVYPVLAYVTSLPDFAPNRYEVSELFSISTNELSGNDCRQTADVPVRDQTLKNVPCFRFKGKTVWGATAMILAEFREVLDRV